MDSKDVIAVEKQISEIIGMECRFEFTAYDGAKRLNEPGPGSIPALETDGLLRDNLEDLPKYYYRDYVFWLKTLQKDQYGYNLVSHMRQYQLPGCCGVAVSSAAMVQGHYRKKGLNTILNKFRIDLAKHFGYSVLMCSDVSNNEPSKKTLVKNGWKDIYQFKNRRTQHMVDISVINLT